MLFRTQSVLSLRQHVSDPREAFLSPGLSQEPREMPPYIGVRNDLIEGWPKSMARSSIHPAGLSGGGKVLSRTGQQRFFFAFPIPINSRSRQLQPEGTDEAGLY